MVAPARTQSDVYREQVRVLSEALPAAVAITDPQGAVLWTNPYWTKITGLSFEASIGEGWSACVQPRDRAALDAALEDGRRRSAGAQAQVRLRVASGEWRWFQIRLEPLQTPRGRIEGWICVSSDIHEQVRANLALKEGEERFRLIAENAPVGLWVSDADGACAYANAQLRAFWGGGRAGADWTVSALDEDRAALAEAYRSALANQGGFAVEGRHRRADGEIRILSTQAQPRRDAEGAFLGMIGVNVDVTEARRAEHHHRLLINELNHRVKNTLATVQSLAHQTVSSGRDSGQIGALLEGRLMALSAAHNVLNRDNWDAADLATVVGEALAPFEEAGRLELRGPPVRIGPQAALAIALAVHELATNAVKYGALSTPAGSVEVAWRRAGATAADFEWRERGGPQMGPPSHQGFGSRLLRSLAADLGAPTRLDFRKDGLVCRLRIVLAGVAPPP